MPAPDTLLTRYLEKYLTDFHQTYVNDALWRRDRYVKLWGQKVKGQGHDVTTYAENSTLPVQTHVLDAQQHSLQCVMCAWAAFAMHSVGAVSEGSAKHDAL